MPEDFHEIIRVKIIDLIRDATYQRKLNKVRGRKIADNFNVQIFDPITVSRRGNKWAVVDGATRVYAAELKGYEEIPANASDGLSEEEEARLFVLKNRSQKRPASMEEYQAALIARDVEALEIQEAADSTGWTMGSDLRCIGTMQKAQKFYGTRAVHRALAILRDVLPQGDAAQAWTVGGLAALIGKYPHVNDARMIRVITDRWKKLVQVVRMSGEMGSSSRPTVCAELIRDFYNSKLPRGGRSRLPEDHLPRV